MAVRGLEAAPSGSGQTAVAARGYWSAVWSRLRRDRVALAAGVVLALVFLACFAGAPIASRLLGHGPNTPLFYGARFGAAATVPVPPWTWIPSQLSEYPTPTAHSPRTLYILGGDGPLGRDEFLRLLYGGRTSLEIAIGASLLAILIGTTVGMVAGFFGGLVDAFASRTTEFVAAFPFLLLVIGIGYTVGQHLNGIHYGMFPEGVLSLVIVIGAFTWPYPARIVRSQVISLRKQEFVDAARVCGASDRRIIVKHLLPHVAGTLIAYASLVFATNVVLEAALSILNVGLQPTTASWGTMLAQNWGTLLVNTQTFGVNPDQATVWTQVFPAAAVLVTVLSFSLFGEALREAIDPRSIGVRR